MSNLLNLDEQGYLRDTSQWSVAQAMQIAQQHNLVLSADHWIILNILREFYLSFQEIPIRRVLLKKAQNEASHFDSQYFAQLFPQGLPQAIKIAGLPKPARCYEV